ncbi:hypothetical protein [Candidatus Nanohalobium constans]|uniref:Prepilin type IV endopeptidase peptidase domain-containing protein n=1 Tax=Candidatus Nanohalobium constans TaxID=2565781 RepID=A0A5Q0UFY5_9ARCH|nr:hypothetical protein [Candidatus Nanohalobium constans]QGA80553.1 hypothetical protein LC1Nh_0662 [Candidatus Nanohalobium constans]
MTVLVHFSHILTFATLFIASIFDVRSELGDVPDEFAVTAIIGGLGLHAAESFILGSWNPLIYSVVAGTIFSFYGWFAYWKGMWGGADALGLSALGFGAPYLVLSASGFISHSFNMFFNLVAVAFVYTLVFASIRALKKKGFGEQLRDKLYDDRLRIGLELGLALVIFGFLSLQNAAVIYAATAFMIFLYRFLQVVEEYALVEEVDVDELDGGEVLKEDDKIRGVSEEEISELDGTVEVMHGLRFMPVFPAALVLTDAGFTVLQYIILG